MSGRSLLSRCPACSLWQRSPGTGGRRALSFTASRRADEKAEEQADPKVIVETKEHLNFKKVYMSEDLEEIKRHREGMRLKGLQYQEARQERRRINESNREKNQRNRQDQTGKKIKEMKADIEQMTERLNEIAGGYEKHHATSQKNARGSEDSKADTQGLRTRQEARYHGLLRSLMSANSQARKPPPAAKPSNPLLAENVRSVLRHVHHPVMIATKHQYPPMENNDTGSELPDLAPVTRDRSRSLHGFAGLTVSSFACVSLAAPRPVVSFNIRLPSRTYDLLAQACTADIAGASANWFHLHVLSGDAAGARAAEAFRTPSATEEEMRGKIERAGLELVRCQTSSAQYWQELERKAGIDELGPEEVPEKRKVVEETKMGRPESTGDLRQPLLKGPGVVCVLRCRLLRKRGLIPVRDHALVLAEVTSVIEGHGSEPMLEKVEGEEGKEPMYHRKVVVEEDRVGLGYVGRKYRGLGAVIDLEKDNAEANCLAGVSDEEDGDLGA